MTQRNINSRNKELSPEQQKELLRTLKARFENRLNFHEDLAAGVFAMTVKLWSQGKIINRKITPWIWQRPWALKF